MGDSGNPFRQGLALARSNFSDALKYTARRASNLGEILTIDDGWALRRRGVGARRVASLRGWSRGSASVPGTILDLGAYDGHTAREFAAAFPASDLVCFEPALEAFKKLVDTCSEIGPRAQPIQVAVGADDGTRILTVRQFAAASSLYPMTDLSVEEFPETAHVAALHEVPVTRLDSWLGTRDLRAPVWMKLDVQGAELEVLQGADQVLSDVSLLVIEISVEELYYGAPSFGDVLAFLEPRGFSFRGTLGELKSPRDGRLLQFDGVFLRRVRD